MRTELENKPLDGNDAKLPVVGSAVEIPDFVSEDQYINHVL